MVFHKNINPKEDEVTILISDKVDLQARKITSYKEGHTQYWASLSHDTKDTDAILMKSIFQI